MPRGSRHHSGTILGNPTSLSAFREAEELEAIAATEAAALAEAEAAAEEAIAAQMFASDDDDSAQLQSNENSTKTTSTLKARSNNSLESLADDGKRNSITSVKSSTSNRGLERNASATTQVWTFLSQNVMLSRKIPVLMLFGLLKL